MKNLKLVLARKMWAVVVVGVLAAFFAFGPIQAQTLLPSLFQDEPSSEMVCEPKPETESQDNGWMVVPMIWMSVAVTGILVVIMAAVRCPELDEDWNSEQTTSRTK